MRTPFAANLTLQIQADNDKSKILSLAFSPITHELAAGGEDGAVTVWDLDKHEEKFRVCSYGESALISVSPCDDALNGETKEIRGLAFNSDASLLISGSSDKRAWLWDAQTGDLLAKTPDGNAGGHINTVTSVAFNPNDKRQVATVSWDNTVRLWNLVQDTNKTRSLSRVDTLAGHSNSIWATAFAPDARIARQPLASRLRHRGVRAPLLQPAQRGSGRLQAHGAMKRKAVA